MPPLWHEVSGMEWAPTPVHDLINYIPGATAYVKYAFDLPPSGCEQRATFWVWTDGRLTNRDRLISPYILSEIADLHAPALLGMAFQFTM
jgi:hypothetical protein